MLDILKQKLLSWSPEKSDEFYKNMTRFVPVGSRIWEITPTGYFLYDSIYSAYFDNNGRTYSLILGDITEEYTAKQVLSDASIEHNSIAIERPNLIETADIYGMTYTYVEESRPYNGLGFGGLNISCYNDAMKGGSDLLETERAKILQQLKDLAVAADLPDYSDYIDIYDHACYDPATANYFLVGRFTQLTTNTEIFEQYLTQLRGQ